MDDSTEVRADLNFTLEDDTDDRFLALYKFTEFKEGLSAREFGEAARAAEEKLRPKVAEVQELINRKLEEL